MGAKLSDLTKLVVFHVPVPGCGEREIRDLLARALGPDVLTTLTVVALPRLVSPGLLIAVDAYAMRSAAGRRLERTPLDISELPSLPEPFCHGLRCEEFIFTSGQAALDERGEIRFDGDLPSRNRHALEGVAAVLDGFGASPGDIVKFNTWRSPRGSQSRSPAHHRHRGGMEPPHAVAVGHLVEAIAGGHRADPHRLEQNVVTGVPGHGRGSAGSAERDATDQRVVCGKGRNTTANRQMPSAALMAVSVSVIAFRTGSVA